jgi:hypothetical protein
MLKSISTATSTIVTFIVSLALNTASGYWSSSKGEIIITNPISISGKTFVMATIENQSSDAINGLLLEVPSETIGSEISSDQVISIEDVPSVSKGKSKILKLSQIPSKQITRIIVPVDAAAYGEHIKSPNASSLGIALNRGSDAKSTLPRIILPALIMAIVIAIGTHVLNLRLAKLQSDFSSALERASEESTKFRAEFELLKKKFKQSEQLITKSRLLLQARLADHSKELNFWRNAVRSLLMKSKSEDAEQLINHVTTELKTFGALSDFDKNFTSIKIAAQWVAAIEKEIHSEA